MLNDIKDHLRGAGEREDNLLKIQSELEEKVQLHCIISFSYVIYACSLGIMRPAVIAGR